MPRDQELADRIRDVVHGEPGLSEKRMFGGLAFMVDEPGTDDELRDWVGRGVAYARSLPPK